MPAIAAFTAAMLMCACSVGKACEDTNGALGDWNDEALSLANPAGLSGDYLNTGDADFVPYWRGYDQSEFPTLTSKLGD